MDQKEKLGPGVSQWTVTSTVRAVELRQSFGFPRGGCSILAFGAQAVLWIASVACVVSTLAFVLLHDQSLETKQGVVLCAFLVPRYSPLGADMWELFWQHPKNLHCEEWKPWVSECAVDMGVVISRIIAIPMGKQQSVTHRVQLRGIPNHLSGPHMDANRKYPPWLSSLC